VFSKSVPERHSIDQRARVRDTTYVAGTERDVLRVRARARPPRRTHAHVFCDDAGSGVLMVMCAVGVVSGKVLCSASSFDIRKSGCWVRRNYHATVLKN
jgi:hypothetical protein